METNEVIHATLSSIQSELLTTIWTTIKPHLLPIILPTATIMLMVRGTKVFVDPYLKTVGERRTKTIYRASAVIYGWLWLWVWPMVQNYLATIGTGSPSWKVVPYPLAIILVGGFFLGVVNILAYDFLVRPFYLRFIKRDKK